MNQLKVKNEESRVRYFITSLVNYGEDSMKPAIEAEDKYLENQYILNKKFKRLVDMIIEVKPRRLTVLGPPQLSY